MDAGCPLLKRAGSLLAPVVHPQPARSGDWLQTLLAGGPVAGLGGLLHVRSCWH